MSLEHGAPSSAAWLLTPEAVVVSSYILSQPGFRHDRERPFDRQVWFHRPEIGGSGDNPPHRRPGPRHPADHRGHGLLLHVRRLFQGAGPDTAADRGGLAALQ